MKKFYLMAAAALCGISAMAQEVSVTMAEEHPFTFSTNESYVSIYLGEETQKSNIPDDNYIYIGPDENAGRNLWIWENTFNGITASDLNSFGVPGEYMAMEVGNVGWSGLGYNIAAANPIDLSYIDSNWSLHFAVKMTSAQTVSFQLTDGNGKEAKIVLGKDPIDGVQPVADFPRDGEWYNIDIPMTWFEDKAEFTFADASAYADKNYFVLLAGGVQGTVVNYDAVFFHGPKVANGISTVKTSKKAADGFYNLNGQRIAKRKGLVITKCGDKVKKMFVK